MTDLYKILGVESTATPDAIRKAWRKLAQKLHPDRAGGDQAAFTQAKDAFEVLIDVERRARYDATGATQSEPENGRELAVRANAQQGLQTLLVQIVEQMTDLPNRALDQIMADKINEKLHETERQIAIVGKKRAGLVQVAERFTPKAGQESVLSPLAASILQGVDQQIEALKFSWDVFDLMLKIVEGHDYRADLMLPSQADDFAAVMQRAWAQAQGGRYSGFRSSP